MSWGGKREGAGRPKTSPMVSHLKRPRVGSRRPLKVTLKIRKTLPSLRNENIFEVFEKACLRARRFGLRVIHFAITDFRIVMICEFKNQDQLEKSFKSLNTSLAIALKKEFLIQNGSKHEGPVFLGRFEMDVLTEPEQCRIAIRDLYLAASWQAKESPHPDSFSSAPVFKDWRALLKEEYNKSFEANDFTESAVERAKRITALPQYWLTNASWSSVDVEKPSDFSEQNLLVR